MVIAPATFPPLVCSAEPALIPVMTDKPAHRIARFTTRRSSRCAVLGPTDPEQVRELWVVVHGYGQLATGFVGGLGAIDDGSRLVVAPEALSRFYDSRSSPGNHAEAPVGASWMTREDRLHEIADTIGWLQQACDAFRQLIGRAVPLTVLGFSQGAAAASRWVASGRVRPVRLICWGASLAPELDLGPGSALRGTSCVIVTGATDRYVSAAAVDAERARLDAAAFPYRFVGFDGGHRLDDDTLRQLAAAT